MPAPARPGPPGPPGGPAAAARVVSAFPAGCGGDATALVFEYMAATQAETGRPVPGGIGELPPVLQHEYRNLPAVYRPPGALLVTYAGQVAAGCAGLAPCLPERTAQVRRLGHTDTAPCATESPVPMIYMERLITGRSTPG